MTPNDQGVRTAASTSDETERSDSGRGGSGPVDARVYRVLGELLLRPPSRDRVDAIGVWASEWRCTARSLPLEIESALERIEAGAAADEDALRSAYTHLFRGVSERAIDPPYESLYVDGQFYSETTTEIRQGYRWAGLDVDQSKGNEPADHLGLELQFLGELLAMDDAEVEDDRGPDAPALEDAQWWLLDEHLVEWVPAYHARVQATDPPDFYGGLLDLALAVIETHHAAIARED